IAHTGCDVYGEIALGKFGNVAYTGYFGSRSDDTRGRYRYSTQDNNIPLNSFTGTMGGADVRWTTNVPGLLVGYSFMKQDNLVKGTIPNASNLPYSVDSNPEHTNVLYVDYSRERLHVNAEYRNNYKRQDLIAAGQASIRNGSDMGCSPPWHIV
ncbi:MAG TPA: hypothetical protein VEX68_00845, partial [Bryobacteraceae bacterium]|nr:hypothetical protein [Bryobacteraceae bacterium]